MIDTGTSIEVLLNAQHEQVAAEIVLKEQAIANALSGVAGVYDEIAALTGRLAEIDQIIASRSWETPAA